jgi:hypothetical protein
MRKSPKFFPELAGLAVRTRPFIDTQQGLI